MRARERFSEEPFAVLLADDIVDATVPCLKQMIQVFNETHCPVRATELVDGPAISAYGVVDIGEAEERFGGRLFEIKNIMEKAKAEEAGRETIRVEQLLKTSIRYFSLLSNVEEISWMRIQVRKAVFPAAGLGKRFLAATKAQPIEMLPLVDKPIIQYGLEEALASGCDQIIIVTGRVKTAIEDHLIIPKN